MSQAIVKLKADVLAAEEAIIKLNERYATDSATAQASLQKAQRFYREAIMGLNPDMLSIARSVIFVRGNFTGAGEQNSCRRDFINWLATGHGPTNPQHEYFGAKDYDRWSSQRSDHPYGMGPKHGSVVFALGLNEEARKRDLTDEEKGAAIYFLENLGSIEKAKQAT